MPYETGRSGPNINRANQMRRDNDIVKVPKVTLYDIDYAIHYHLSNFLRLKVENQDVSMDIPVIFASGEKWSQIRQHGYIRDSKNKIMAPLISIRRMDITPDDRLPILDLNNFEPTMRYYGYKSMNMQYDRVAGQYGTKPSFEYYTVDMPNYIRLTYEVLIWTELTEQMNGLLQDVIADDGHHWGDYFKFRTTIQGMTTDTVNLVGSDRVVKTTLNLQVDGYLRNEYERHESNIQKAFTIKRMHILNEQEESDFYLDIPTNINEHKHISEEPQLDIEKTNRRNIRYDG